MKTSTAVTMILVVLLATFAATPTFADKGRGAPDFIYNGPTMNEGAEQCHQFYDPVEDQRGFVHWNLCIGVHSGGHVFWFVFPR
jgi:hypothetical protein